MDPVELRRRNFITEFPATIASGLTIDSGDYHASLDRALEQLDLDAVRAEQAERRERGDTKQLGHRASRPTSRCAASLRPGSSARSATSPAAGTRRRSAACRAARCRCSPAPRRTGRGTRRPGRRSRPTSSATRSTRSRCCTATRPSARSGWTRTAAAASPSAGSRSTTRRRRSSRRRARSRRTSSASTRTSSTTRTARSAPATRAVTMKELAFAAWYGAQPPARASSRASRRPPSTTRRTSAGRPERMRPSSRSTPRPGDVQLLRYVAVDDVGKVVNPMIVDGQIHGGITQGVAQALFEEAVYDEDGVLLTSSLTNYLVPSAVEMPVLRARPHRDAEPDEPARGEGRRRDGRDRLAGGGDERRHRTRSRRSASPTSTCRPRPSGCGGRSRRHGR